METLLAHCTVAFSDQGGLLAVFFLAGLTGGFTHCLVMCGPFLACERMCQSKSCKSIAQATGALVGQSLGGGNIPRVREVVRASAWLAAGIVGGVGLALVVPGVILIGTHTEPAAAEGVRVTVGPRGVAIVAPF